MTTRGQRNNRTAAGGGLSLPGCRPPSSRKEQQNQVNYAICGQTLDAFSGSRPGVLPYVNDVQVSSQTAPVSGFPLGGEFCLNTAVPGAPRMVPGEITYRFE
jgi:hypothetical protein